MNKKMSGRIIGGSSASPHSMPWQIFIRILKQYRSSKSVVLNRWAAALKWATELLWWAARLFSFCQKKSEFQTQIS